MIYQNLAIALAATSTLAAAAPKASYYAAQTTGTTLDKSVKTYDSRGFVQTASFSATEGNLSPLDDTQTAIGQYLSAKPTAGSIVGADYVSDHLKVPPTFFTAVITSSAPTNGGAVHVHHGFKRTSHKQWSESQTLSPPAEFKEQSNFGISISADRRTNRRLAVGCPGCNATAPDGGQVYLYSPGPNGLSWSQTQTLGLNANNYHDLGNDVSIHDDVVLASVQTPYNHRGYAVFQRGPAEGSSFEFQQILTNRGNITSADVYEDTIVLGNTLGTIGSTVAGEVQILYPSTPEFGLKPASKPRPVQWSVQQVLHASDYVASGKFGGSVSIDRNTLIVSATASASSKNVYVFQREEKGGMWSQQQSFAYSGAVGVSAAGNHFFASTSSANTLYSTTDNWDCLVLSLEDQFGDDWDTAELIVSAPDGTRDFFSKGCDAGKSLKYRYCPNDRSDEGVYSFSIPEAIKAKHYWEITWRVFDENKGNWYIGQWDTKMDFHWDSDSLSFYPRKMDKVRTNTTCSGCPSKPTDKPTPVSRRNLKGSETLHPTVSPAPTLKISTDLNWRALKLITTGSVPWFNAYYQGTEYYVSDAHGHRLLHSGTACTAAGTTNCWLDLPDGDYHFRIGGGNDVNVAKRTFQYCKMANAIKAQNQLSLRIRDGDCSIVSFASRDAVCKSNGYSVLSKYYLVLNVNMIIYGTTVSEAGSNERTVFSAAVASLFPGMQSNDVDLVSVTSSGSGTFVTANLKMSSDIGYDLVDYDQELAFETFLQNAFASHSNELSLAASLTSGPVSSAFSHVTKVEFVDYQIVGSHEEIPTSALSNIDEVASYADSFTISTSESTSSSSNSHTSVILDSVSYSGYFLAALGVLFLAGFVIFKTQTTSAEVNAHQPIPEDSETSSKIEIGRRQLSPTSSKPLTLNDLQELAQMEQDYLKITTK